MNPRLSAVTLAFVALSLSGTVGSAQAQPSPNALAFRIVVPPHCFEPSATALQDAPLLAELQHRRLLCAGQTGKGTPQHLELTNGGLRISPGKPNVVHRGGT